MQRHSLSETELHQVELDCAGRFALIKGGEGEAGEKAAMRPSNVLAAILVMGVGLESLPAAGFVAEAQSSGPGYEASGRREPFKSIDVARPAPDPSRPPLQRFPLTDLTVIAIVSDDSGFAAMIQTPDGHGFTVRPGTPVGSNNGIVVRIDHASIVIKEPAAGADQKHRNRNHVLLLRPSRGRD